MEQTDWNNCYKIKVRELKEAQAKHLVVKTLLVQKLLIKHLKHRNHIRVYTEFNLGKRICDIYFENLRTREVYIYEIQERITDEWLEPTRKFYKDYEVYNMTNDLIVVSLRDLPDNLEDLYEQLNEYMM